jgi:hypothetical protein
MLNPKNIAASYVDLIMTPTVFARIIAANSPSLKTYIELNQAPSTILIAGSIG